MAELGFTAESDQHPFCCGVDNIGGFDQVSYSWSYNDYNPKELKRSGTGLYTAEFIRTAKCKLAYEWLCQTKRLVYQSPIRRNIDHHGGLFLCVFEDKK